LETKIFLKKDCPVVFNKKISKNRFLLRVKAPEIARAASPGQFVQIKLGDFDPLLPRPFAVSFVEGSFLEILYEVRGKGTHLLSLASKGSFLCLLGPLGKGFVLPEEKSENLVLVAGGMGLAPLRFLTWKAQEKKYSLILLYGDRHPVFRLPLESLFPPEVSFYEIFEEGREKKGLLTDLLSELIGQFLPAHFFVCGPRPMMKKVELWISSRAAGKTQFSFEEKMGCGYGACRGCVIPTREGLKRVCCEGPVFKGEEVDWELI